MRSQHRGGGLQVPEGGAHLVEHRRAILPDLTRQPEELYFALESLLDQTHFLGGSRFALEQIFRDARLQTEQCTARGLGGVRGEHGTDVERQHRLLDCVGVRSELPQLTHRPACRRGLRLRSFAEVSTAPPYAVRLLSGVDQQKEEREGSRGNRALLYCQSVHFANVVERSDPLTVTSGARCGPKALDDIERLFSLEPLDNTS